MAEIISMAEDHRAKIEKKALAPRALRFLVTYKLSRVALRTRMLRIYFDFFFSLSSRYPFAFLFIASMKSWLASISNKGTNLICKISSVFFSKCCLLFVCKTVRIGQNLLLNEVPGKVLPLLTQ